MVRLQFGLPLQLSLSAGRHIRDPKASFREDSTEMFNVVVFARLKCQCAAVDEIFTEKAVNEEGRLNVLAAFCAANLQLEGCRSHRFLSDMFKKTRSLCQSLFSKPSLPAQFAMLTPSFRLLLIRRFVQFEQEIRNLNLLITLGKSKGLGEEDASLITNLFVKIDECCGEEGDFSRLEELFATDPYISQSKVTIKIFFEQMALQLNDDVLSPLIVSFGNKLSQILGALQRELQVVFGLLFTAIPFFLVPSTSLATASGTLYELFYKDFGIYSEQLEMAENVFQPMVRTRSLSRFLSLRSVLSGLFQKSRPYPPKRKKDQVLGKRVLRGQGLQFRLNEIAGMTLDFGGPPLRSSSNSRIDFSGLSSSKQDVLKKSAVVYAVATSAEICSGRFCAGFGQWGRVRSYFDLALIPGFLLDVEALVAQPVTTQESDETNNLPVFLCEAKIVSTRLSDQVGDGSLEDWIFLEDWRVPQRMKRLVKVSNIFSTFPFKLFNRSYDGDEHTCLNANRVEGVSLPVGWNVRAVVLAHDDIRTLRFSFKSGVAGNATREYRFEQRGTGFSSSPGLVSFGNMVVGLESRHQWSLLCTRQNVLEYDCQHDRTMSVVGNSPFSLGGVIVQCGNGKQVKWIGEQHGGQSRGAQLGGATQQAQDVGHYWNAAIDFLDCALDSVVLRNVDLKLNVKLSLSLILSSGNPFSIEVSHPGFSPQIVCNGLECVKSS